MKLFAWIFLGFIVTGIGFWFVAMPGVPRNPFLMFIVVGVFGLPPIGAFWMLYVAVRYEKHPLPLVLLAMLSYTFLWCYFERIRPRKALGMHKPIAQ
jgi:hypothetical protein